MIGIDTNVLVRYLTQDDEAQSRIATRFIEGLTVEQPGFVTSVVLAEVSWVLARAFKARREEVSAAIALILHAAELKIENPEAAHRALALYRSCRSAEFADALIAAAAELAGAPTTVTFDQLAADELGMRLLT